MLWLALLEGSLRPRVLALSSLICDFTFRHGTSNAPTLPHILSKDFVLSLSLSLSLSLCLSFSLSLFLFQYIVSWEWSNSFYESYGSDIYHGKEEKSFEHVREFLFFIFTFFAYFPKALLFQNWVLENTTLKYRLIHVWRWSQWDIFHFSVIFL